jgi:hypothetical protein
VGGADHERQRRRRRLKPVPGVRAILLLAAMSLLVAATAACGGEDGTSGSGRLVELSDTQPIADAFNEDKGHARLVLLLSPT